MYADYDLALGGSNASGLWTSTCSAKAPNGPSTFDSHSLSGTITLYFDYDVTMTSDHPPISVMASYGATTTGKWNVYLFGSGSASGSYACTTTQGMIASTISDSFGPYAQTTMGFGYSGMPKTMHLGSTHQVVSTPLSGWTLIDHHDGTYTYRFAYTSWSVSGSASATCDVFWKNSYGSSQWTHTFDSFSIP